MYGSPFAAGQKHPQSLPNQQKLQVDRVGRHNDRLEGLDVLAGSLEEAWIH